MRPTRMLRQSGFTLIEMMVVTIVIGIIATFFSFSMGHRVMDDRMDNEAARMERILQLASEEAETKGIDIGVRYTPERMELLARDDDGNWKEYAEGGPLRTRAVSDPFYTELFVEGRAVAPAQDSQDPDKQKKIEPQFFLLSSGEVTPFALNVRARGYKPYYHIEADALGHFKLERHEEQG
ncbi:MAG TPA: type II secretion system minor pseudopilin GspH [Nevskiaceae bacterium]|nr:type II secretion system minor pseudopilin GspH [Nevskiaceae bacterium]